MARIPLVTRDQIVEKERPAYDAFMLSRANRPNIGPYTLLLYQGEHRPMYRRRTERAGCRRRRAAQAVAAT
jgi:hypothetical protein